MAAGDTGVRICSDALLMLGAKAITSFNDGTDSSSVCDRLYPNVRDSTLTMVTAPGSYWKYAYQLPGDRLGNPMAVYPSSNVGTPIDKDWEIQGDQLLTNLTAVFIDYQYSVPEYAMPQYFVQLLKYQMAWHIAEAITEQQDKSLRWQRVALGDPAENMRGGYFRQACQMDAQGNPSRVIEDYTLVAVRY
jgi:hypothetical protein